MLNFSPAKVELKNQKSMSIPRPNFHGWGVMNLRPLFGEKRFMNVNFAIMFDLNRQNV